VLLADDHTPTRQIYRPQIDARQALIDAETEMVSALAHADT
jgi:hypothetical protein